MRQFGLRTSDFGLRPAVVLIVAASLATGCEGKRAEPTGLGPYQFGRMTRGQLHNGVCQPTELSDGRKATWCFALPPIKIYKHVAEVDAYFLGSEPTAPLIEVQLKVRGCVEDELDRWLRERYGPPIESLSTRQYWKNSFLWIGALMPSEPSRCLVHFLPLSENAEIDRIKQQK